jgi:cell surface protein SprA
VQNRFYTYFFRLVFVALLLAVFWSSASSTALATYNFDTSDSLEEKAPFPISDNLSSPTHPLHLQTPKNIEKKVTYEGETHEYKLTTQIGENEIGLPEYMDFKEFQQYDMDKAMRSYWKERVRANQGSAQGNTFDPKININNDIFEKVFGGSSIDIRPQGSAELLFGIIHNRQDNPTWDIKRRRTTNFDFQEKIQMNVTAKIGDKIQLGTSYNTEATFDFENKMKLAYEGKEDEIIKLIEAGDVNLPLNSSLITGSQSLFGIKTKLQFGKLMLTSVASQQKSQSSTIEVAGGAQVNKFELKADQYEENKHFFIAHYFRDNYNYALSELPLVKSAINITKIEVWVTNVGAALKDNRNIVAFADLGESKQPYIIGDNITGNLADSFPNNSSNNLYSKVNSTQIRKLTTVNSFLSGTNNLTSGVDYEKIENARKLAENEYTFNNKLGFISLNTSINSDQVLAVAYEYKIIGKNEIFQVGEFSSDGLTSDQTLIVKLLKAPAVDPKKPLWNLMMKNVYALGGFQVNNSDFRLNILYFDKEFGVPLNYIKDDKTAIHGIPLIQALGFDKLNNQQDRYPDGIFDFIDNAATIGGTIQSKNGRVFFPVIEPFGKDLRHFIDPTNPNSKLAGHYAYDSLYSLTKNGAQQYPNKNKFIIEGSYKSASGSDISLNAMNVPKGSVKVTAGGIALVENQDYTVDYTLGRVKIINEGILNSGTPVKISLENNSLFAIQSKTLLGTHAEYTVSKNFTIGGTIMRLSERPMTQKINFGSEPIANTIWGLNTTYETEAPFLTKLVDYIPFIDTKEASSISITSEFAHLIPGHSKAIGKSGTAYIDDFEGSRSEIDLKGNANSWALASTPQKQTTLFPEAAPNTGIKYGFNRALLAWYIIDPNMVRLSSNTIIPDHLRSDKDQLSNHLVREIYEKEVFPNKETPNGEARTLPVLNLSFYPSEKGAYNYDVLPTSFSAGINIDGSLKKPNSRWGGIMRNISTTDFETRNVEYIEFWMMDPFESNPNSTGGSLYFNLGDVSEDILRDSEKSFENGLPSTANGVNYKTTPWGRVPSQNSITNSFDNNAEARIYQDVGYDGLSTEQERVFFQEYLNQIEAAYSSNSPAYVKAYGDPSSDDYHYFRGDNYDALKLSILDRYKKINHAESNSPTSEVYANLNKKGYPTSSSNLPNKEDINGDNTLNEDERYFQYKIDLKPNAMQVGQNNITDIYEASVRLPNNTTTKIKWYQFKIPIRNYESVHGNIYDFKSIRFIRLFLTDFDQEFHCRFATLKLVSSEWRKYNNQLWAYNEGVTSDYDETSFDVNTVNIEENGKRIPIPYVLPAGIEREKNYGSTNLQQLNEQSLVLKVCNLEDGNAKAVYKTANIDIRPYNKLNMYVHAEAGSTEELKDNDLTVFVRLGSDFTENYYEYEVPLKITPWYTAASNVDAIWPKANEVSIDLKKLIAIKIERDTKARNGEISKTKRYESIDASGNTITIMGVPNMGLIKTVMLGIRNPSKKSLTDADDMLPKCAEVWLNELRLMDFDESGGWAALTRVTANLADLGNVAIAGTYSTPGFGGIESKINDRQKEYNAQYDIATNVELGKFLPETSKITIPMHYDYSQQLNTPEYNPLNPDVLLKDDLATIEDKLERKEMLKLARNYTQRKNLNFMNVRKNKTNMSAKPKLYDISNFDLSYAFSQMEFRDIEVEYSREKNHKGGIGYAFSTQPKQVKPFAKIPLLKNTKSLRLISDFNFSYLPKSLLFRTNVSRNYQESQLRANSNYATTDFIIPVAYSKKFYWDRMYNLKWDLAQSLRFDYIANANARIDEPEGLVEDYTQVDKQAIRDSILTLGRMTDYNHKATLDYTIPINKLPLLDWVTASASYSGNYNWLASSPAIAGTFGNTAENGNTKQLNGSATFTTLYNKVKYLKEVDRKYRNPRPRNQPTIKKEEDSTKQINYAKEIADRALVLLTSVRNASFTYSQNEGIAIPGFMSSPTYLGLNGHSLAPGIPFIIGLQDDGFPFDAAQRAWLTKDSMMTNPIIYKYTENTSYRATIEPINSLRIQLTGNKNFSETTDEYYTIKNGQYTPDPANIKGNFSMSFLSIKTAFRKDNEDHTSSLFDEFSSNRKVIAFRIANQNSNWVNDNKPTHTATDSLGHSTGYPIGYGPSSVDVLIPAFLAAYSGKNADDISLDPFQRKGRNTYQGETKSSIWDKLPLPNWRLTYDGLAKIPLLKKYFKTINISHGYRSSYTIGSFSSNINYQSQDGYQSIREELGEQNYIPQTEIKQISISEQFNPLINFDMTWNNSLISKIGLQKSRTLSMSFANNQLTEVTTNELVLGLGYRFKDVTFYFKSGGSKKKISSDLKVKTDFALRTNKTMLRRLDESIQQPSAGQRILTFNFTADYMLSERFEIRFYLDNISTNPFVSSQYPTGNTNGGFSLRFTLAQ